MKKILLIAILFYSINCYAQADNTKQLRAFPITSYIVDLNDSVKVVQLEMPDGLTIKEKQIGLLRGVYGTSHDDTVLKGYGRCNLIKGNYYYFTIGHNTSYVAPKEGDLIYVFLDKTDAFYGQIPKLASHFIQLLSVYDEPFYDRYIIFNQWTENEEKALIDSMVKDIKFTGNYFMENNPSMDKVVPSGKFKGKKILTVMAECKPDDVKDFMSYVYARPLLYAGRKWKVSEVFATWAIEGAPTVIKD